MGKRSYVRGHFRETPSRQSHREVYEDDDVVYGGKKRYLKNFFDMIPEY